MSAWRLAAYRAVRPVLFRVEPESIHHQALRALRLACCSITISFRGKLFQKRMEIGAGARETGAVRRKLALDTR